MSFSHHSAEKGSLFQQRPTDYYGPCRRFSPPEREHSTMTNQTIKLNERGIIDVDYYTRIGRQQHSEYIALKAASLKTRIKSLFQVTLSKPSTSH